MTFLSASSAQRTTSGFPLPIPVPAGVMDGDLMVTILSYNDALANTVTAPGWTEIQAGVGNAAGSLRAFYRVASSEPASYDWTWMSNPSRACGTTLAYRNATVIGAPHIDAATVLTQLSPAACNVAAHAVAANGDIIYGVTGPWETNPTVLTLTDPAQATHRASIQTTNGFGLSTSDEHVVASSEPARTGTFAWTTIAIGSGGMVRVAIVGPPSDAPGYGFLRSSPAFAT